MKPVKRTRGQTAMYEGGEWIYAPLGLKDSTWRQIHDLRAQGKQIQVIDWPQAEDAPEPGWLMAPPVKVLPHWLRRNRRTPSGRRHEEK